MKDNERTTISSSSRRFNTISVHTLQQIEIDCKFRLHFSPRPSAGRDKSIQFKSIEATDKNFGRDRNKEIKRQRQREKRKREREKRERERENEIK